MTDIFTFLSDDLIHALGWTFVHTLWQGSLIALLMTAILSRIQHHMATRRYLVAALSLLAVLVSAVVTFSMIYTVTPVAEAGEETLTAAIPFTEVVTVPGIGAELYAWISDLNPFFVSVWVMGVLFFALRFAFGLAYLRHLKSSAAPIPDAWQQSLDTIVARLKYNRHVKLAQSAVLRIPVVVGSIKPVVLFPIGMINQLQVEEVEAILAHEVAHLMRNDFVHNLIQSLIEMVFYYHPAVWWISANVRAERENCCDDLAVQVCGNSLTYAKALVRLEDISYSAPALALPFAGSKNHLLNRIKRILNQPQNKSNVMEKVIATVILVGCVALLSFSYKDDQNPVQDEAPAPVVIEDHVVHIDTVPRQREVTVWRSIDGKEVEMRQQNGEITYLKVDGEVVDPSAYDSYQAEIDAAREVAASAPRAPEPLLPPHPPLPPAPPVAPMPSVPPVPPVAPAPPVPPMPPMPELHGLLELQGLHGSLGETNSTTTTIIREKSGNGYTYRIESDGDGSSVVINSEKGIAVVDGQEIELDADSVFIIEKEEKIRNGVNVIRPRMRIKDGDHTFNFASPDNSFRFYLPGAELTEEQKEKLKAYQIDMEAYSKQWEDWGKEFGEKYSKDWEKYAKEWELAAKEWEGSAENQARWNQYADDIRVYTDEIARDAGRRADKQNAYLLLQESDRNAENRLHELRIVEGDGNVMLHSSPDVNVLRMREREPFRSITSAMERDGIIEKGGDYSIVLEADKLKVNGKRMPDEVHEKYLEIFERSQGYEVTGKTKIEITSGND